MTNQEHFDRSVAVLVKAFLDGDLECTECAACACGNLVAAANGYKIVSGWLVRKWLDADGNEVDYAWNELTWGYPYCDEENCSEEARRQVASTGYTAEQLYMIEDAFMTCDAPRSAYNQMGADERNFIRLMNVVDVLAKIHSIDLATVEASKLLFVKA